MQMLQKEGGKMCKYSIGMDFGTLSGRALLVSVEDGRIAASAEKEYAHA